MEQIEKEDDTTNWKQTGLGREDVRSQWEAISQETRPGWATFVRTKRETHERNQKTAEFEKVLDGFEGVKVTLPADLLPKWLEMAPETKPLKILDSVKPNHKTLIYRLSTNEKDVLQKIWEEWKAKQIAPVQ